MQTRLLVALLPAIVACGPPLNPAHSNLMDQTTAGRNRCLVEGDQAKLFVVEWDATDTATFEALADRDLVFVPFARARGLAWVARLNGPTGHCDRCAQR